jgi:PIN domain nuclease of toxin-antitoxin system
MIEEDIDCSASLAFLAPVGGRLEVKCVPLYPIILRSLEISEVIGRFSWFEATAPPVAEKTGR